MTTCPHCPDGHTPPTGGSQPWAAHLAPTRDGDGQPMQITVARSAGAHVAESDAEWVRTVLNHATPSDTRRFTLVRDLDVTGVSGIGTVADGVLWPDGTVSIRWRGERPSIVHWDHLEHAEYVHGHGGFTRIVWTDPETPGGSTL